MTEAVGREVAGAGAEPPDPARLAALFASGSTEAMLEAESLTWDMIDIAPDFAMDDPEGAAFTQWWWLDQIKEARGEDEAEEVRKAWDGEVARKRVAREAKQRSGDFKDKLDVALAKAAPATPEPAQSGSLLDVPFGRDVPSVPAPLPAVTEAWPEAPLPPDGATELERLTYPRGLLGHAVQYIVDADRVPDRWMALAGALVAGHKALDRKILGPGDISVVLFLLLLAESGAGKQHIMNCIRILLRAMGAEEAICGTGIASVQSIDEILEGPPGKSDKGLPSALVTIDEYGSFLTRIFSKGSTGNVSQIPAKLQTLWGWHPQAEYLGDIKVGKAFGADRVPVYGPAFSIFGITTERGFFGALKEKQVSGGFVNRHLLINAGRGEPVARRPKYSFLQCPEWLLKALKEVSGKPAPIDNRPLRDGAWVVKDFRRIGWGAGAEDSCFAFENENRALPLVEDREIWIRAHEIALRAATVLAVFRGKGVVDVDDLEWGIGIARHSTTQLGLGVSKHMLDEMEQANLVELIREKFEKAGPNPVTLGQIHKLCERKTNDHRKIGYALDHLQTCGDIIRIEQSDGPGRPTDKWFWHATVKRKK
jgi:hypothetical protein